MMILRYLFFVVFTSLTILASASDALDSEGYPIMYVRGSTTDGWSAKPEYRMTRNGETYTITLPTLDGEFKISGSDWQYNFGADGDKLPVTGNAELNGVQDGANYIASNLIDVTISFSHSKNDFAEFKPAIIHLSAKSVGSAPTSTLPVLYINVFDDDGNYDDEILDRNLSHKNYFAGEYWLDVNGTGDNQSGSIGSAENPLPLEIKARGNYTRTGFAKKPFKIKLGKKQSLLGLSKSKHFALLAHADDNFGYLRNFCGFNLGQRIGLPWTPTQQPIELVINGDYRGLYFLTESIRIESDRIAISELNDNEVDPALASGGYLIELDNYDESNQIRMSEKSFVPGHKIDMLRITWDTPEDYSKLQQRFITDQFSAMNDCVGNNDDKLWSYIDIDDAARYYIVEEIISHTEAFHGSTYMFRDRGENQKWHFSPLWDCGNAFNGSTENYFYNCDSFGNTWIPSIALNKSFNDKVRLTWRWFMGSCFEGFFDDIDDYVALISDAAKSDRARWKNAPRPNSNNATDVADNSNMNDRRNSVIDHITRKLRWLASQWGSYGELMAEPERDTTPAAPLPEYLTTGIESVISDETSVTTYYSAQGLQISDPHPGNFYIARKGNKAIKIVF